MQLPGNRAFKAAYFSIRKRVAANGRNLQHLREASHSPASDDCMSLIEPRQNQLEFLTGRKQTNVIIVGSNL